MGASSILLSYIDPVSGVILLQLIIGGCVGCIARFRHQIWRFFSKRHAEEVSEAAPGILPFVRQPSGEIEPIAPLEESLVHQNARERPKEIKAA